MKRNGVLRESRGTPPAAKWVNSEAKISIASGVY
jgi:hypothetical protein